jgi:hypothetical protein
MTWVNKKIERLWSNNTTSFLQIDGAWRELVPNTKDMYEIATHSFFSNRNAWIDLGTDNKIYQVAT